MIIAPKVKGFICTTAHPAGCKKHVDQQIEYIKKQVKFNGPKRVLVIGASTGYGLASRIAATFGGSNAATIGVFFEREAVDNRTASPGWYNTVAFEQAAANAGIYAKSINGDAFSKAIKQQVVELIKKDFPEGVDLIIYSLASPRRQDPETGQIYQSVLKPIGNTFTNKNVNILDGAISLVDIYPATLEEVENTTKVMGGEDWALWIEALSEANVISQHAVTLAYSYIGPDLTYPIYRSGTIGKAKEHLEQTAIKLQQLMQNKYNGQALVSVNKCLVTQASAAIPIVPLYTAILYKIMKSKNLHEGCIEQIYRLFKMYEAGKLRAITDTDKRIRLDDWELRADVQAEVLASWEKIHSENAYDLADLSGYRQEFYHLFGFNFAGVDYSQDVEAQLAIPSIAELAQA